MCVFSIQQSAQSLKWKLWTFIMIACFISMVCSVRVGILVMFSSKRTVFIAELNMQSWLVLNMCTCRHLQPWRYRALCWEHGHPDLKLGCFCTQWNNIVSEYIVTLKNLVFFQCIRKNNNQKASVIHPLVIIYCSNQIFCHIPVLPHGQPWSITWQYYYTAAMALKQQWLLLLKGLWRNLYFN